MGNSNKLLRSVSPLIQQRGVTSIEYALVASLIAMTIVVGVSVLGQQVGKLYAHISDCIVNLGCP